MSTRSAGSKEGATHPNVRFSMVLDVNENDFRNNENTKQKKSSRKRLLIVLLSVFGVLVIAAVAITVGLIFKGGYKRAIHGKNASDSSASSFSTPIPSSFTTTTIITFPDEYSSMSAILPTASYDMSNVATTKHVDRSNVITTQHVDKLSPSTSLPPTAISSTSMSRASYSMSSSLISSTRVLHVSPITPVITASVLSMSMSNLFTSSSYTSSTVLSTFTGISSTTPSVPVCEEGEYRCTSGQCVDGTEICNGVINCHDQTDEIMCPACVKSGGFQCESGLCIWDGLRRCNGVFDCDDLSDELGCPRGRNQHECDNGILIPLSYVCNGVDNCDDNSDEANCRCSGGRIACADGHCIMRNWVCDGYPDCVNATDEMGCSECSESDFTCRNYECVARSHVCDGVFDCSTGEDEGNCVHIEQTGVPSSVTIQQRDTRHEVCADGWTDRHSHYICQHLDRSFQFTSLQQIGSSNSNCSYFLLNSGDFNRDKPISAFFDERSVCPSMKTVAISCAQQDCGNRKLSFLTPYVAGGHIVQEGKWPWVVSLTVLGKHRCAGAILNQQLIITAGHCIVRPGQFNLTNTPWMVEVQAGSVNRILNSTQTSQRMKAAEIMHHPNFTETMSGALDWDAALIKLERPLLFSDYVQPICLPYSGHQLSPASLCYLAGWGLLNDVQNIFPRKLREAKMQVWSDVRCRSNVVGSESSVNINSTLCAGYITGLPSGCQGDSGGPLMCQDLPGGPWALAGIMSSGRSKCGNFPSFHANRFTRTAGILNWIQNIVYGA